MSGYNDPYSTGNQSFYGGGGGQRHGYNSSTDYNNNAGYPNPYGGGGGGYEYNPYSQQPEQVTGGAGGIGRGASIDRTNTTASRYTNDSAAGNRRMQTLPPPPPVPPLPPVDSEDEFSAPVRTNNEGPNVLRKPSNRGSYGVPLDRDVTRQSLTPGTQLPSRSATDIKRWRGDHHGNLWTKGSRVRCCGRFFCCTILIALLLIVSIILTLIMWVRPPNISFTGIQTAKDGNTFEATTNNEFKVNLGFGINVTNPNYFSANFPSIKADIFYPINNVNVGGGEKKDVTFNSHSNKQIDFPFSFVYSKEKDPDGKIMTDIVNRCGLIDPSTKKDLSINYKITLNLKVIATVSPSFSGTANFACPLNKEQVQPFLKGLGVDIPGL